ncbi:lysophospholipid acyltransferase family protein [Stieleria varia]|uniref:Phospholipid/glycerol acyltransferase domain-containing protein n=1 Tax=Stieleria varia TaxID=2528005 RepID=A0A5C6B268_9BACT|nr:lysophospholipid acyltransferase family protein [Stieleria varia]TWU06000.1 hypothetical protein Pla52n_17160 [Stieleria varia]
MSTNESSDKRRTQTKPTPPPVADWLQNGFHRFLRPMLRRAFHSIALERQSRQHTSVDPSAALIVYANHPSWWDPLIAHFLNRTLFNKRQFYAPIDSAALEQYRVFAKLGFFGVQMQSTSGAAAFLKQSTAILNASRSALWLTPEGRFADSRDHSAPLMPGLAHLCTKLHDAVALPMALEYVFWEERLPECLVKFGEPIAIGHDSGLSKSDWSQRLTTRLRDTQAELSTLAIARDSAPFENLLPGKRGGGMIYDTFRRAKALATGKRFRASHGEHFEQSERPE